MVNQGRQQRLRNAGANAQVSQHGKIRCTVFAKKPVVNCAICFLSVPAQSPDGLVHRLNPYVLAQQSGYVADPVEGPQFKGYVRRV